MKNSKSRTATLTTIIVSLIACMGCEEHDLTESYSFNESIVNVDMDLESGDIIISPTTGDEITVDLEITYRGDKPDYDVEINGSTLEVNMDCHFSCRGNITVYVPAETAATLETGSGDIRVRGLDGDIQADTGSGDISLKNLVGDIEFETGSGDVSGSDLGGQECFGEAGSGDIRIAFINQPSDVDLETGSGDVNLKVPSGNYDISISTGSGDKSISDLTLDSSSENTIQVETGSGDVSVTGI